MCIKCCSGLILYLDQNTGVVTCSTSCPLPLNLINGMCVRDYEITNENIQVINLPSNIGINQMWIYRTSK
jgi:hypothetical protein